MCFTVLSLTRRAGEKIKMGPLWDFDLSFGNVDYADSRYPEGFWIKYNPWMDRLFDDTQFVDKVKTRFAYFSDNQSLILDKIDAYAIQLNLAQQQNQAKWGTIGTYVWPNPVVFDTYSKEISHMKAWYRQRMTWLNSEIKTLVLCSNFITSYPNLQPSKMCVFQPIWAKDQKKKQKKERNSF